MKAGSFCYFYGQQFQPKANWSVFLQRSQSGATLQTDVASTVKGGRKKVLIYFSDPRQVLKAVPVADRSVFVSKIAYSPLIGGYAIVLNDGRAAVLFASTPSFDPNVRKSCRIRSRLMVAIIDHLTSTSSTTLSGLNWWSVLNWNIAWQRLWKRAGFFLQKVDASWHDSRALLLLQRRPVVLKTFRLVTPCALSEEFVEQCNLFKYLPVLIIACSQRPERAHRLNKLFSLQSVTGVWALQLEDANSVALNHKYKLIAFGRNK